MRRPIPLDKVKQRRRKKEQQDEKLWYVLTMAWMGIVLLYYIFLNYPTIGGDYSHILFTWLLPGLAGMAGLAYYYARAIRSALAQEKAWWIKGYAIGKYFIIGLGTSFFTTVFAAQVIWNYCNKAIASQSPREELTCPVVSFRASQVFLYISIE